MRKFRCPHCGKKTFDFIGVHSIKYPQSYIKLCANCGGECIGNTREINLRMLIVWGVLIALMVAMRFVSDNLLFIIIALLLVILSVGWSFYLRFYEPMVPYNVQIGQRISGFKYRTPYPNAIFELNCSKGIRTLFIYGIKFDNTTLDIKFKECFTDGLVPVVFHERRKGSNVFEVRIIGKKFVPEELLHIGSEFLVEDNNQFICRGTVTQIFKDVE